MQQNFDTFLPAYSSPCSPFTNNLTFLQLHRIYILEIKPWEEPSKCHFHLVQVASWVLAGTAVQNLKQKSITDAKVDSW